jgi:hypothetical protein
MVKFLNFHVMCPLLFRMLDLFSIIVVELYETLWCCFIYHFFASSKNSFFWPFLTLFWTPIFDHFWPFLDPCFLVIFDPFFVVVTCKFLFVDHVKHVTFVAWMKIFHALVENPILPHFPSYFDRLDIEKPSPCK